MPENTEPTEDSARAACVPGYLARAHLDMHACPTLI